jgi:N-methylhydantoinase A
VKVAFDTGGTFTDLAVVDDAGHVHVHKVLSTPLDPAAAVLRGVDEILARQEVVREIARGGEVVGATTIVTNALLERRGARTALVVTAGFRDLLQMRTEARYDLYDLGMRFGEPLVPRERCFGVAERMTHNGLPLIALDTSLLSVLTRSLAEAQVESVAVCLLHSYANPDHEQQIGTYLRGALPGVPVSISSEIAPEIREYERASTVSANAYTQPLMQKHVAALEVELARRGLHSLFFMTSSGGMVSAETAAEAPIWLVESGPAAGALSAARHASSAGAEALLSFDMGGTTAKLCVIRDGKPAVGSEFEVARQARFKRGSGIPLKIHAVQLIEIGAGGGSLAEVDHLGLLRVGPRSAGASPGPACYGAGGEGATVTDADLLLGYLDASSFLGGSVQLRRDLAEDAVGAIAAELDVSPIRAAWGIHDLVNEQMAQSAVVHCLESGVDARTCALVAFGGAGPTHANGIARKLGLRTIICPLGAGVCSALGLLGAPLAIDLAVSAAMRIGEWDHDRMRTILESLEEKAATIIGDSNFNRSFAVDLRHVGQGHEVLVPLPQTSLHLNGEFESALLSSFADIYQRQFRRFPSNHPVEAVTWRLHASAGIPQVPDVLFSSELHRDGAQPTGTRQAYFPECDSFIEVRVYSHTALPVGALIEGPAVVEQGECSAIVDPGSAGRIDERRNLVITLGSER